MKVTIGQINTTNGDINGNVDKIIAAIEKAKSQGSDLIVFPEITTHGYTSQDWFQDPDIIDHALDPLERILPATKGIAAELKQLNWASIGLAIAVVGIEFGFLLTYRAGWNLGIAAVLVNVVASLILVPVAIIIFKDKISWINFFGILVCLAGLVMLNWKR